MTPGARSTLRSCIALESPLQVAGAINAYTAVLAVRAGFRVLYLSGSAVAVCGFGLPDLGMTTPTEVFEEARRITAAVDVPLIVDIDTGWGNGLVIRRVMGLALSAGVGGVQIEDQVAAKRCGHRPGKQLVPVSEMRARIRALLDARTDAELLVIARTDALASEGLELALDRARAYVDEGADVIFAEAVTKLEEYAAFTKAVNVPVLANLTEFGKTPLFTVEELRGVGVGIALYPLTAFRVMSRSALNTYQELRSKGTQRDLIPRMQTRDELYEILDYHVDEQYLDNLATLDDLHPADVGAEVEK